MLCLYSRVLFRFDFVLFLLVFFSPIRLASNRFLNGAQYFDAASSFDGERIDSCMLLPNPTRNHNSQGLRLLCIPLWELGLLQAGLVLATRSLDVSDPYNIAAALIFL